MIQTKLELSSGVSEINYIFSTTTPSTQLLQPQLLQPQLLQPTAPSTTTPSTTTLQPQMRFFTYALIGNSSCSWIIIDNILDETQTR